ncbi:hypothetical protein KI387_018991, partial [Taxus chinensis]
SSCLQFKPPEPVLKGSCLANLPGCTSMIYARDGFCCAAGGGPAEKFLAQMSILYDLFA